MSSDRLALAATRLDGWGVIVTGGSGGLGAAVAERLAAAGAVLTLVGRRAERLREVAEAICHALPAMAPPLCLALDVGDEEDMQTMAASALRQWGRIDALVACAGIARGHEVGMIPYPVHAMTTAEWDEVLTTNLRGTFLSNRAVLPHMLSRRTGTIVNISSSPAGVSGQPFAAAYCASKAAVAGFSEALAAELRASGGRVHCVFPDLISTALIEGSTLAASRGRPMPAARVAAHIHHLLTLPDDVELAAWRRTGPSVMRSLSGTGARA